MSTVSPADQAISHAQSPAPASRSVAGLVRGAAFVLFILANAMLFFPSGDILPRLQDWPIYQAVILLSLAASFRPVIAQLKPASLLAHPITFCVVGLLPAVVLSQAAHFRWATALNSGLEFAKVVLYYLLLVALINSSSRLRTFLLWLTLFACAHVSLAVLQHHAVIDLQSLHPVEEQALAASKGEIIEQYRICGLGTFHDPNNLGVLAAAAIVLCFYHLADSTGRFGKAWWGRAILWALLIAVCLQGLRLTQSRGAFLSLLGATAIFLIGRFGWRSVLLGVIVLPLMFRLFSGRQSDTKMFGRSTAQSRFGFWSEGMKLLSEAPLFGIGQGKFTLAVGNVAHNSFIHSFTELGLFGGTLLLGAFFLALWPIFRIGFSREIAVDDHAELRRLRPYLLAVIGAWTIGMLSLSRSYVPTTYTILGLATVYQGLMISKSTRWCVNARLLVGLAALSAAFLAFIHTFIKVMHKG